jgi:hypothetical protein
MPVIDENGDLFGTVNAVDALAVVLAGLVLLGGVAVLAGTGGSADRGTLTQSVTLRTDDADAATLQPGPTMNPDIAAVEDVREVESGPNGTWEVDVQLVIETSDSGAPVFDGERLYIGRSLSLQLDGPALSGVVTGAREPERVQSVPRPSGTPTPEPTSTPTATPPTATPPNTGTPTPTEPPAGDTTRLVTVETTLDDRAVDAVTTGPVEEDGVVAVRDRTVLGEGAEGTTVALQLELAVTETDGALYFRGVELAPGTRLRLALDGVTVAGTVTEL